MSTDRELDAIGAVAVALRSVDARARDRILRWAVDWAAWLARAEEAAKVEMPPIAEKEPP